MMIKIFLISACFAASANGLIFELGTDTTQADGVWKDTGGNPSSARIRRMANAPFSLFAGFPNMPTYPDLPDMSNFPNIPEIKMTNIKMPDIKMPDIKMPDIKMPDIKMPDIKMPEMKMPKMTMPDIKFPSPDEIASHKERGYTGVSVVTSSNGDTVVTINEGGDVKTYYTVPAGSTKKKTSETTNKEPKAEQPIDA